MSIHGRKRSLAEEIDISLRMCKSRQKTSEINKLRNQKLIVYFL